MSGSAGWRMRHPGQRSMIRLESPRTRGLPQEKALYFAKLSESPYRSLAGPLLRYIDAVHEINPGDTLVVVLPEYVPSHWWEQLIHNQTALRLKTALLFHPGVIVADVPYHLAP